MPGDSNRDTGARWGEWSEFGFAMIVNLIAPAGVSLRTHQQLLVCETLFLRFHSFNWQRLSVTSALSRSSSALVFLLLLASLHGTAAYPALSKTQDTCIVHHDTQEKARENEAILYPTKKVSKRAIFDLIPHKVRILQKKAELATHHKKKNRKVLNRARPKCNKKEELRHLLRKALKSHYNHRRTKGHKIILAIAATNTNTAAPTTTTTTSTTESTTTTTSDWEWDGDKPH